MSMKRCTQCNELLPLVSFRKGKNQCNACRKAYMKAYRQTDKYKAYKKAYQKAYEQTDKHKAYQKAYMKAYRQTDKYKAYRQTDKYEAYKKAYQKVKVEGLADGYVKKLLTKNTFLHCADIPPELVAVKRLEIQLKRELRK